MTPSPSGHERPPTERRLTLDDISDLRAYERERDERRARVIAVKSLRRVGVGPLVSVVFENRETVRHQVQEMVRAERLVSDAQVQIELDTYNPLIPLPGELSATVFIELTDEALLREWLPKLVGIERHFELRLDAGPGDPETAVDIVVGEPDAVHEELLTRSDVTSTVHYMRFRLHGAQLARFDAGPVWLACTHPEYREHTRLSEETKDELRSDLVD